MIYRKIKPSDRLPEEPGEYFVELSDERGKIVIDFHPQWPYMYAWDSIEHWLEEVPEAIM